MKLIYGITVFPLISTLGLYLILNLAGALLIRGQRLKEGGRLFQGKVNTLYQTSKLCFCPFQQ